MKSCKYQFAGRSVSGVIGCRAAFYPIRRGFEFPHLHHHQLQPRWQLELPTGCDLGLAPKAALLRLSHFDNFARRKQRHKLRRFLSQVCFYRSFHCGIYCTSEMLLRFGRLEPDSAIAGVKRICEIHESRPASLPAESFMRR